MRRKRAIFLEATMKRLVLIMMLSGCEVESRTDFENCMRHMLAGKGLSAPEKERVTAVNTCKELRDKVEEVR